MKNLLKAMVCAMLAVVFVVGSAVPVLAGQDGANVDWQNMSWQEARELYLEEEGYAGEPIVIVSFPRDSNFEYITDTTRRFLTVINGISVNGIMVDFRTSMGFLGYGDTEAQRNSDFSFLVYVRGTNLLSLETRDMMHSEINFRALNGVASGISGGGNANQLRNSHLDSLYIFTINGTEVYALEFFTTFMNQAYANRSVIDVFEITTKEETASSSVASTPSPTPAPPATQPQNDTATFEQTMFQLVNEERARHGLQPFINNPALATVAREHSMDMYTNNMMGHTGSNGSTVGSRLTAAGISWRSWAENVAMNRGTAEQVLQQWLNSPEHRANILSNNTYIGIGRYGNIATQKFISN